MTAWELAGSLQVIRAKIDALAPGRSKVSDGTIGDEAHQKAGTSDHLPRLIAGRQLVTALDVTHDPAGGMDCARLATALLAGRDDRVKYVIFDGQIASGAGGPQPWIRRKYSGVNPHRTHLHLSVVGDARCQDRRHWVLDWSPRMLRRGDRGDDVRELQRALQVAATGIFDPATDRAVRAFQRAHGLTVDGLVGPATRAALDRRAA